MSGISTHVLDTGQGQPASGMAVSLERHDALWYFVGDGITDANGRIARLLPDDEPLQAGLYRLTFQTNGPFFPEVIIAFEVADPSAHYHVPLLLSPYGYTTYRGS